MWQISRRMLILPAAALMLAGCATTDTQTASGELETAAAIPAAVQQQFDAALASLAAGDDAAAIQELTAFIERNPTYASAYVNLAILYERQKQSEQALELLKKAIEVDPSAVEALNRMGVMSRKQGDLAAAEGYWRQATMVDPTYPNAWYNLGVFCELYKQDFPAALENYRRYQALTDGANGDPTVARWIEDLERRTDVAVQAANTAEAL